MSQSDTVRRILDTAEVLFAQKGFAETSLRAITGKAGVNLAAVNYHFGSKEALIQAVFERYLTPFCQALSVKLRELELDDDPLSLERLLTVASRLALGSGTEEPRRAMIFFRLAGQAYSQPQDHLRAYLRKHYGDVFNQFTTLLRRTAPDVPPVELFWRVHFSLGAVIFTLSGMESLQTISKKDFNRSVSASDIAQHLLPFVVGGIKGS
ncbi:TetR family transcriptional regulator [Alcanivorax balearicus MACL04]|uniref:TetR family transcriptional regulator n=1 Tax=Alloalcanivorax balearicus MACL04 TaxID=1177182 RepID=A0ABT2R1I6_9GAMM|nr:TetR/AcrR family transcriptional regulator [Alloalcanivorax balearicus]MCU5783663.1 TetR family transcriptional regulator [Alloalcanivorax balearicus MACL04]